MSLDPRAIIAAIKTVIPTTTPAELHKPDINGHELKFVTECVTGDLVGYEYVRQFEDRLSEITGAPYVIAMASGTAALHIALMAAGVKAGDEVLVPALTFVATANAVSYIGAVPNFVDGTIGINAYKLRRYLERETRRSDDGSGRVNRRTERRIAAIVPVHLLGVPADIAGISAVAEEFGLIVVEDAAEALGSSAGNRHCGTFGSAGVISFNNNKMVTTNGGGALLASEEWLTAKAWQLSTTARLAHPWKMDHDAIAWNYRMANLNAALGLAQLERFDDLLKRKNALAGRYRRAFDGVGGVEHVGADRACRTGVACTSNYWLNAILLGGEHAHRRDEVLGAMHAEGIKARAIFTPLHQLPMYRDCPRDNLGYAEDSARRMICLPSGFDLCASAS